MDGRHFRVRHNCYYALWQARLHYGGSYFWIDSVCIDQDNTGEKNTQVAMMGDIFGNAACVLACIGAADDINCSLLEVLDGLICNGPDYSTSWAQSLEEETYAKVRNWWNSLSNNSYWLRVWIRKELWSNPNVEMNHGRYNVSWQAGIRFLTRFSGFDIRRILFTTPFSFVRHVQFCLLEALVETTSAQPISKILSQTKDLNCQDTRDHIYGYLKMIDWTANNHVQLVPDYGKSAVSLAIEVLDIFHEELDITSMRCLNRVLGVDHSTIETYLKRNLGPLEYQNTAKPFEFVRWGPIYRTRANTSDYLTIDLDLSTPKSFQSSCDFPLLSVIYAGNDMFMIACGDVRAYDVLFGIWQHKYLILREGNLGAIWLIGLALPLKSSERDYHGIDQSSNTCYESCPLSVDDNARVLYRYELEIQLQSADMLYLSTLDNTTPIPKDIELRIRGAPHLVEDTSGVTFSGVPQLQHLLDVHLPKELPEPLP